MPALLGALLAGLLVLAPSAGLPLVVGVVLVLQVGLTVGLTAEVRLPGARSGALLALLVGAVGTAGAALHDSGPDLSWLAAALGVAFTVAVVLQLARRDGRARLTSSLSLTATALVLVALPVWLVAVFPAPDGSSAVAVGGIGAGAALLAAAVPLTGPGARTALGGAGIVVAVALGTVLGAGTWLGGLTPSAGGLLAGAVALIATAAIVPVSRLPAEPGPDGAPLVTRRGTQLAAAVLPLSLAAPVIYLLARLLLG